MTAPSRVLTPKDLFAGIEGLERCRVASATPLVTRRVELAFDETGRPLEVSLSVRGWLVYRLRELGGRWQAVTGREGRQLMVPVDADAAELFVAVSGVAGRYCLEPVDGQGRSLASEPVSYLEVVRPVRPVIWG